MMTPKQEAALRQALEALKASKYDFESPFGAPDSGEREVRELKQKAIAAIDEALAEQPAQQQEPVAMMTVQFEKVAEGIEVGYDMIGGVDIRLGGEFVYVHINYDYRYTHNAARKALADQIVGLLTSPPIEATPLASQRSVKPWVGLEESEWREIDDRHDWTTTQGRIDAAEEIEAKLKEKNT